MEKEIIEVILKNGEKAEGEILFTFEANGDNFVMYSIGEEAFGDKVDEEGTLIEGTLRSIEDDKWKIVEPLFNEYMEE